MGALLKAAAARGLFYLDDGTSRRSLGQALALEQGLPTARADVVLDATADPTIVHAQPRGARRDRQAQGHGDRHGERPARPSRRDRRLRRRAARPWRRPGAGERDHLPRCHRGGRQVSENGHYRPCVGIMLLNGDGLVFVGRRRAKRASDHVGAGHLWQMPQGGIDPGEDPYQAALRELAEETNVTSVELLAEAPRLVQLRSALRRDQEVIGAAATRVSAKNGSRCASTARRARSTCWRRPAG